LKSELEIFREFLRKKGMRYTPEREIIIKEIFATHDHFDVDSLYISIRKKKGRVSKASIYRLIPLLIEANLIDEVFFDGGQMYYEHIYGHEHHCHLRCIKCRSNLCSGGGSGARGRKCARSKSARRRRRPPQRGWLQSQWG
jgi:Fur family ferric uptake transcriptional regulator